MTNSPAGNNNESVTTKPLNVIMFYHSIVSDWNNGNAHFLRGIVQELTSRNHHVVVYEARNCWSMQNLVQQYGPQVEDDFCDAFPHVRYVRYNPESLQLDEVLDGADLVIVHEWNEHSLVADIGKHHVANRDYVLLFHDTHHRSITDPGAMASYDLSNYDGVLAFGKVIRDIYLENDWIQNAWTWHEAVDTSLFFPRPRVSDQRDLVWIGNWGDDERTADLHEFLFQPAIDLKLKCDVYGVRYPDSAMEFLCRVGIHHGGWIANYNVPEIIPSYRAMVHVPRRPYREALRGIPTIRPFEAMACGIPLISAPWDDDEHLFSAGTDYLMARSGREMTEHLGMIIDDPIAANMMTRNALRTIRDRHTCAHRVDELFGILDEITVPANGKAMS